MCTWSKLCVFACAPFLAAVYVSALIWQALLGCRQAGSWIMAPALLAVETHFQRAAGRECHVIFFQSFSSTVALSLSLGLSVSLELEMAAAQVGKSCGRFGKWLFSPTHFVSRLSRCCYKLERGHIQDEKQVSQEKCESLYAFSWYQHQLPLSPILPQAPSTSLSLLTLHFCILSLSPLSLCSSLSLSSSLLLSLFTLGLPMCVRLCLC